MLLMYMHHVMLWGFMREWVINIISVHLMKTLFYAEIYSEN